MRISILFFATLKDRARTSRAELTLADGATVAELKTALADQFPDLTPALPT
ncbi:MAG: molybdopterin converting factor, partial [Chloroflexi bacterium]|nr:molybdopterin converting factor [Chloroflexota bacterium]